MAYVKLGQTQRKQTEMLPKEIAAAIETLKGAELSKMSHADLYSARVNRFTLLLSNSLLLGLLDSRQAAVDTPLWSPMRLPTSWVCHPG